MLLEQVVHSQGSIIREGHGKDNKMRSPSLLSGPKISKAYFEASNRKMLLHRPPLKSDFKGGH